MAPESSRGRKVTPKSQRKISEGLQTPKSNPRTGIPGSNPNDAVQNISNRSNQISFKGDTTKPFRIGLQDIDGSIFYYFENVIKPSVMQNGQRINVPVIYGNAERWKQMQKDGYYRDKKGKIMLPLITFKRNSIDKIRNLANKLDANFPNNYNVFTKKYNKNNTYDKFNILNNRKPVEEKYAVVVPDYVTLSYDVIISTYYVEQMNGIVEAINYASDSYCGNPERFKFRARIDSFTTNVELPAGADRVVKSTFSIKMYGYIVPNILQKDLNSINKFNTKARLIFNPEVTENLAEILPPKIDRFKINHGGFTSFTDPPTTRKPRGL